MREIVKRFVGHDGLFRALRRLRMRWLCLRYGLKHVHPTAYISTLVGVEIARDVRLAEFVYVGNGCVIGKNVSIGRYTMLAPRVSIVGADHRMDVPGRPMIFAGRPEQKPTMIGDDAWIGVGAVVMQGVTIGRGAVVGANAVVTKDIPAFEIWVGIPARRVGARLTDPDQRCVHERMLDGLPVDPDYCR